MVVAMVIIVTAVMVAVVVMIVPIPVVAIAMLLAIVRRIDVVIPTVAHEIDLATASVVLAAIAIPVFVMAGRNTQIERWPGNRNGLNHYWLTVNHDRWWSAANINLPVEAGLTHRY